MLSSAVRTLRRESPRIRALLFLSLHLVILLVSIIPTMSFPYGSYDGYYTLEETYQYLTELTTEFPEYISYPIPLATTSQGRSVRALCLGASCCIENVSSGRQSPEFPRTLYSGLMHAREPMGLMAILYFLEDIKVTNI